MKNLVLGLLLFSTILSACQQKAEDTAGHATNMANTAYYTEPHRPQYHFTPEKMWMNDPNGLVFFEGEYHLFYQHYPKANVWGPMHWGHAVSRDLVHWEHLPIALYPDSLGLIFSGSAVVDWNYTSGFGDNGKPSLVAIFTHHLMEGEKAGRTDYQYQSIAFSNDRGRTWTKYKGNPVIPNTQKIKDFRDPKVFWDRDSKQWVMVFAAYDHVKLWGSPDLKNWKHLSDWGKEWGTHGGVWECPDLFPMTVEGTGEKKWVLLQSLNPGGVNGGSGTQYFVGNFDGKNFKLDPGFSPSVAGGKAVWLDWGPDNYAGVTWSDVPKTDGRRLFIGWMSNWLYGMVVPTEAWRSAMTLPRQLILKKTTTGPSLFSQPVKELETLRSKSYAGENQALEGEMDLTDKLGFSSPLIEIKLEFELPEGTKTDVGIALSNIKGEEYRVGFDAAKNEFYSDRTKAGKADFSDKFAAKRYTAPRVANSKTLRLHLFFDVASCELFADDGGVVMTNIFFPTEDFSQYRLYSTMGQVKVTRLSAYQLTRAFSQ
ncbi:MAG: glycoside hydrolase family 32 protein [Bacteroidetes bacterium]|nr:glycoside hydrolase family 32 protein [Bacteroidota bacterium]